MNILKLSGILALLLTGANTYAVTCSGLVGPIVPPSGAVSAVITSAVPATVDPNQGLVPVPHCLVNADIVTQNVGNPSDTSTIKIVLRMPDTWNSKLFMGGQGGLSGNAQDQGFLGGLISLNGTPLSRGYSTVTTDTGHQSPSVFDGSWALEVPPSFGIDNQKELNFAYTGVHLAAVTAKSIINTYYGQLPIYSYFHGCSNGGRQAIMEASRYPGDFDGFIAGAPSARLTPVLGRFGIDGKTLLPIIGQLTEAKLDLITQEVLKRCDAKDRVVDGIINNPNTCNFKASRDLPACTNDVDGPTCFTKAQIAFINFAYSDIDLINPLTGKKVRLHGFEPGSEAGDAGATRFLLGWSSWLTGTPLLAGVNLQFLFHDTSLKYLIFDAPSFNTFAYLLSNDNQAIYNDVLASMSLAEIPSADLSELKKRGGKIVMYNGTLDAAISPRATAELLGDIKKETRGDDENFVRLFMMPGVGHCGFGPGPQVFAGVDVLENWVEHGQAPDSIVAYSQNGLINRPLCPYPQVAHLKNPHGNVNDSSSWTCDN